MSQQIWALANAGWFGLLVGTLIGLASIWIGFVFYKKGKQVIRLRYLTGDASLISSAPTPFSDGLEIRFDGRPVPTVTSTSFGVWNDGTATIYGRDVVQADPLRLEIQGEGEILRATLDSTTRAVNGVQVQVSSEKVADIQFDFLDPGDGFRIQVVHSGMRGSVFQLGTIRGIPRGIEKLVPGQTFGRVSRHLLLAMVLLSLTTIAPLIGELGYAFWFAPMPRKLLIFAAVATGVAAFFLLRLLPEKLFMPSGLKGAPAAVIDDPLLASWPFTPDRTRPDR